MALTRVQAGSFEPGAIQTSDLSSNTTAAFATTADFANFATSLAPKVTSVAVANATFSVLDDTAVNVGGGYIVITGTNFAEGVTVLVDTTSASAVTRVNSTTLRVQVPTKAAASYNLFVVNPDGGTGIRVAGITYSANPNWVTASPLSEQVSGVTFSFSLNATSATSYSVANNSSLPAGTSLLSNGYFYGTVTTEVATTYSFDVVATDAENQDSSKTFSVNVIFGEPFFKYTTLLIQADDVTNNSNNNVFVDSSVNNLTLTPTGTPIQGSYNPFGTGWSNRFNGSSDYLTWPYSSTFEFTTSTNFTMEAWVYIASGTGSYIISTYNSGQLGAGWAWIVGLTEMNYGATYNGASNFTTFNTTGLISLNRWHHVAMVKNGNTVTAYVDGVSIGTITGFTGSWPNSSDQVRIGSSGARDYPSWWSGYISNFRIVKGTALYSSNFTPSTTPLTNVANTILLTCETNSFKDQSTNAVVVTNPSTTSVQKFSPFDNKNAPYNPNTNTGSVYFNGISDYLSAPNNEGFNFGTGDFTIDFWLYCNVPWANMTNAGIAGQKAGDGTNGWQLYKNSGSVYMNVRITGSSDYPSTEIPSTRAWDHWVLTRSSGTLRWFKNGVLAGSYSNVTANILDNTGLFYMGYPQTWGGYFNGYISNLRIVKGTAVYTSNFTPPTGPAEPIANTSFLLLGKNSGIYDAAQQNNIRTVDNAKVNTSISKYGTGSVYLDGTGDYLSIPHNPNLDLGSGDFTIEAWVYWITRSPGSAIVSKGTGFVSYLIYIGGNGEVSFYGSQSGGGWAVSDLRIANTPATGVWHHIAVTRSGNVYRAFFNGTLQNSSTVSGSLVSQPDKPLLIGFYDVSHNGYIDDLRLTKGYARYTASFTLPTKLSSS